MKRESTSPATMETHTKTMMRYYWTSTRMLTKQNKMKTLIMPDAVKIFRSGTITQMDTDTSELLAGFTRCPVLKTIG